MDVKYDHPLLQVTEKIVETIREQCGTDKKRLQKDTQIVLDWCSKEEHLQAAVPYLAKTGMIERRLLLSNGSIEDCKKRIDALLTTRALMPEICLYRDVEEFGKICKAVRYVTLPKVNPSDLTRILVTQILDSPDDFTMLGYLRYAYHMGEYRLYHDYGIAERYILDMKHMTLGLLTKLSPVLIKKSEILSTEAYGTKLKGIHILNAPSFVDKIIFILKQGMKAKVASRIMVHNSNEELQEHIAKEVLPKDYGGDLATLEKLSEAWNDQFNTEDCKKKMKDLDFMVSDETKRSSAKFNEEYLGMPGSFRKLDVD